LILQSKALDVTPPQTNYDSPQQVSGLRHADYSVVMQHFSTTISHVLFHSELFQNWHWY